MEEVQQEVEKKFKAKVAELATQYQSFVKLDDCF